jgi:hypothetical protein
MKHIGTFLALIFLTSFLESAPKLILRSGDDLDLISYTTAHEYIIPYTARAYYNTMDMYKKFWGYELYEPLTLFMEDFSDWSNGGTTPTPRNFIYLTLSPYFYVFEVTPGNERMSLLMHHELTHLVMTDMHNNKDRFWRKAFFGKVAPDRENPMSMLYGYLTTPRMYSPRWYHEGMAVTMETWMSGGIGRALSPYDEMVFRTLVHDDAYIYDLVGLESEGTAIDFQVGAMSYLYGTRFFSYLSLKYGPEKLVNWTARRDGSSRWFFRQFQSVYGLPLAEAWDDWRAFEKEWYKENIIRIRQYPVTEFRRITQHRLGSVSRSFYDEKNDAILTAVRYPGQLPHLVRIDRKTGTLERITEIRGSASYYTSSTAWDPDERQVFFTTNNGRYRDLNVVNVDSGKRQLLMKRSRTGDLAFSKSDKILWGVRHENGISTIVRFKPPYADWDAICAFPYGTDVYDLDVSPDGEYITAAVTHISGEQHLARFSVSSLETQSTHYDTLFNFGTASPGNFVFSDDGKHLYGTSYYSGVSNLFLYDFEAEDIHIMTNSETGFFRPVPMDGDSMVVFTYTAEGFSPVMIKKEIQKNVAAIRLLGQEVVDRHPVVKTWIPATTPDKISLEDRNMTVGDYPHYRSIGLRNAYPMVEQYKKTVVVGYKMHFANHLSTDAVKLKVLFSPGENRPDDERFHAVLEWKHWDWLFHASRNRTDFYDLFGPTRFSRKGNALGVSYSKHLIYDAPRTLNLKARLFHYSDMDELPGYQSVTATHKQMLTSSLSFVYSDIRRSPGAVDDEKGVSGSIDLSGSALASAFYPRISASGNLGIPLFLNHTSFWFRSAAGIIPGGFSASDPFANFYFGGFGNNLVDHREVKQYHSMSAFPGTNINSLSGRHFARLTGELNLSPLRYREAGIPSAYVQWSRLSVFGTALFTEPMKESTRNHYLNAGLQIDTQLVLFTLFKGTLSAGYARSFDKNGSFVNDEFMISLKIH